VKRLTALWEHQRLLAVEKLKLPLVWSAQLMDNGDNERTYCRQRHISQQVLQQTFSSPNDGELIEMILRSLQISGVGPIGLSQQFETQHDIPSKVLYTSKVVGLAVSSLRSPPPGLSSRTTSPASMSHLSRVSRGARPHHHASNCFPTTIPQRRSQRSRRPTLCCAPRHCRGSTSVLKRVAGTFLLGANGPP